MKDNIFKISFLLGTSKKDTKPVLCSFRYCKADEKRTSLGFNVLVSEFDKTTETVINHANAKDYNAKIAILRGSLLSIEMGAKINNKVIVTPELIKSILEGKNSVNYSIVALWEQSITNNRNVVESERNTEGSFSNDTKKKKRLMRFLQEKHNRKDIMIGDVDAKFCADFYQFLINIGLGAETVRMTYSRFANLMQQQHNLGNLTHNITLVVKPKRGKKKPIVYLTSAEVEKLVQENFVSDAESKERDRFIIQCCTGVAHVDVPKICLANVQVNSKGQEFISVPRQKTGEFCMIPFNPLLRVILEKYPNGCLEQISNQKRNVNLAQICTRVGITKKVTTHIGRHTFCVHALNVLKLKLSTVAKIMGHSSTETTQLYYMEIFDETVTDEYFESLERVKKNANNQPKQG